MSGTGGELLRAAMTGVVVEAGDPGYDDARRVWNGGVDRRPALVARCASVEDVVAGVRHAVAHGLELAVRGGAHSASGQSVVDGGLTLDLRDLAEVTVDPEARTARCGGGALLGDLLEATQARGLAVPIGTVSHTGVGGLTLGGGMGWLTRKHGLAIDNLLSAQVVLADGSVVRASADEHAELFWGLRGGGGNFGVVTEFEFALHPCPELVEFAMVFWTLEQGRDALRHARGVVETLPPGVNVILAALNAPPAPFVPAEHQLQPGWAAIVVGFDGGAEHQQVVERLRAVPPAFEAVTPMPHVVLQQMLDEPNAWGHHYYEKSAYLEQLSDEAIDVLSEHVPQKASPLSVVLLFRLDGAYSEVADDATAFSGGRSPRFGAFLVANAPVPELLPPDRQWVRGLHAALSPHATATGTYVNALEDEGGDARVRKAYGPEKYERLARLKAVYDPGNVFHHNANVQPVVAPSQRAPYPDEGSAAPSVVDTRA